MYESALGVNSVPDSENSTILLSKIQYLSTGKYYVIYLVAARVEFRENFPEYTEIIRILHFSLSTGFILTCILNTTLV